MQLKVLPPRLRAGLLMLMAVFNGVLLLGVTSASANDLVDKTKFVEQLSNSIRRVQTALEHVRIEGDVVRLLDRTKPIADTARGTSKHKIYARSSDREKIEFFEGATPDTYFHRLLLIRGHDGYVLRKNQQSSPFYLEFPELRSSFRDGFERDRMDFTGPIHHFFLIDLAAALQDPKFVIEKVEAQPVGGNIYHRATFHHTETRTLKTGINTFQVQGTFDVDPANSHAIVAYHARRTRTTSNAPPYFSDGVGSVEYAPGTKLPEIKKYVADGAISHGQHTRDVINITSWAYKTLPTSEFDLEYYGLGDFERPLAQSSRGPMFWSVVLVSAVLIVGITLRVISQRAKQE